MSDTLIKVEKLSKKFCRSLNRSLWYGIQDLCNELLARKHDDNDQLRPDEFWAVNDVSFELKRGECLGLIGRNGAGKTTLLRMLNGLIKPDLGRIELRGRVGGLISLGAGFNPILTGRENIYVNGAVLGLSKKKIGTNFEKIIEFAELDEFIDAPVQSYSSGMKVRLGFAVATIFEPDILILDEVLAVGDTPFRNKCYHCIASIRKKSAVIFVSHNMEQIARTATTALLLKNGESLTQGSVSDCITLYDKLNSSSLQRDPNFLSIQPPLTDFKATLLNTKMSSGDSLDIDVTVTSTSEIKRALFKVLFYNAGGSFAADGALQPDEHQIRIKQEVNNFRISIPSLPLKNGTYFIAFNIIDQFSDMLVWSYKKHEIEVRGAYVGGIADCQIKIAISNTG